MGEGRGEGSWGVGFFFGKESKSENKIKYCGGVFFYKFLRNPKLKKKSFLFYFIFIFFFGGGGGGGERVGQGGRVCFKWLFSLQEEQLCQIVLKYGQKCRNYGPDKLNF